MRFQFWLLGTVLHSRRWQVSWAAQYIDFPFVLLMYGAVVDCDGHLLFVFLQHQFPFSCPYSVCSFIWENSPPISSVCVDQEGLPARSPCFNGPGTHLLLTGMNWWLSNWYWSSKTQFLAFWLELLERRLLTSFLWNFLACCSKIAWCWWELPSFLGEEGKSKLELETKNPDSPVWMSHQLQEPMNSSFFVNQLKLDFCHL